ncbi:PREDICTED: piRNA biogenesis protein EXD1-like [Nicrophorus vespilloides]|uniref:PiRNA biogenesis protein EXD1-like n=1 Tax=Nicrophorus vespilloides TaxID=110193 RepID=A0ABM1MYG6_NICVS|nr:PREDICTED: piRNA biogenesis protein EXD1-like [Nicrophorus vespilloides]
MADERIHDISGEPFEFSKGQRLIVFSQEGRFEGDFVSTVDDCIRLTNVIELDHRSNVRMPFMMFMRTQMQYLQLVEPNLKRDEDGLVDYDNVLSISEFNELDDLVSNYVYISERNRKYYRAYDNLSHVENIGVVGIGRNLGRSGILDVIVLSSWRHIYIFDLFLMGFEKMPREIRWLMESNDITKVMHDSRQIVDCLHFRYNVQIVNIFDTQFTDYKLVMKTMTGEIPRELSGKNLSECLTEYLGVPQRVFEEAMSMKRDVWCNRPFTRRKQYLASQLAAYLITLKKRQEDLLLSEYKHEVSKYIYGTLEIGIHEAGAMFHCPQYVVS